VADALVVITHEDLARALHSGCGLLRLVSAQRHDFDACPLRRERLFQARRAIQQAKAIAQVAGRG